MYFVTEAKIVSHEVSAGGAQLVAWILALIFGAGLPYAALRCPGCGKWACRIPGG